MARLDDWKRVEESFFEEQGLQLADPSELSRVSADTISMLNTIDEVCDGISQDLTLSIDEIMDKVFHPLEWSPTGEYLNDDYSVTYLAPFVVQYVLLRKDLARFHHYSQFSRSSPCITVKCLIIPGDKSKEGVLVRGVSHLWLETLKMMTRDPDSIYSIDCRTWEEVIAGAYHKDGWDVVVLTPQRGDKGIDVIARRDGWGDLRFVLLDQMKAYSPDHLVGPDEVREMKGVILDHPEATKALITTTSDFTPGALEAAAGLFPRFELRARKQLLAWLAKLVGRSDE